jgi:hypothetical protein
MAGRATGAKIGFRIQDSGVRIQASGVRSQNEEHLLSADCLLLTADCLLYLREAGWRALFARIATLDKMSPPTGKEKTSNFKK